ncbi:hypothetical protein WJU23_08460 [Prosthecobacter sp. SYSU 5D2]|uniref:hypothetical protein n=1 Tax=Prosthecobacter sp. SYSU 5D2 TaxID=3134134 RepID=UPI0031FF2A43
MKTERRHSNARAVLGAMSWHIPDDDWNSPWSFENEWTPPAAVSAGKTELAGKTPPEEPAAPAPSSFIPEVTPHGVLLHFEQDEAEIKTTPVAPAAAAPVPSSLAAKEAVNLRPSAIVHPASTPPVPEKPLIAERPEPPPSPSKKASVTQPASETKSPRPLPRIPRRSNHISWGSLVSLSLGTLGFTLLAWIYLHDTQRESDEDLRPVAAVDQTPTTQAPVKLRTFLDSIIPVENTALSSQPAWTWDTPSLAAFIRLNGTALDNLRDLLEDYDWHPHHSSWYLTDASTHPSWGHATTLLQAQAAYLARRGDEEPAFVAAIDLAEMSRRLQEIWAWRGYLQRALELQTASVQILAELLKSTRLDSITLGRFQQEFIQCRPDDNLMRQACAAYYLNEKKRLLGSASGELLDTMPGGRLHQRPARLFFKTNETLSLFASAFRDLRDEITRPPYTRLSVTPAPATRARFASSRFYHPNSNGEEYFRDRIEPHLNLPQDHSLAQARHGLVRCLFAIRRYVADRRTLPARLNDLSPKYLSSIPQDPFSGEQLQYDPARGLLYSVGTNLIGEGGEISDWPMADDREPTVALGIAIARPVKK